MAQEDLQAFQRETAALTKLGQDVIAVAAKKSEEAQASLSYSVERKVVVENQIFTLANTVATQGLVLSVHKDKRRGVAKTNLVSGEAASLQALTEEALALAKFSVPDDNLNMPGKDLTPKAAPLGFLFDASLCGVELGMLMEQAQVLMQSLTRDKRIALERLELSVVTSFHALYNSHGAAQSEAQTSIHWDYAGMAVDGEEVSGMDYDSGFAYSFADALPQMQKEGPLFVEKLLQNLRPKSCPSYKGLVVLSPRAFRSLLISPSLFHASGRAVMDQKSRWDKSIGKQVLSPVVTMTDNPHVKTLSGATAFDSEGLPTRAQTIIDRGVLQMHMHDCYSAKKMHAAPSAMAGGPFALRIQPGKSSLAKLLASADQILYVDRFSGNSDPITGDFSGVAKSSRLYENGAYTANVKETMIAGNFFDLAQNIRELSDQATICSGYFEAPCALVDGFSVTGT